MIFLYISIQTVVCGYVLLARMGELIGADYSNKREPSVIDGSFIYRIIFYVQVKTRGLN